MIVICSIIGIYVLISLGYLITYILSGTFTRNNEDTNETYTRRFVCSILCIVFWPVIALLAGLCWIIGIKIWCTNSDS